MARGGKRDGAGRPAGAVTKRSREMAENASKDGITPLEYMLRVLRDETAEKEQRMWAAEKAAPYVHARLSSIEHGGSLNITNHEDALDELNG
jgi:hypothetical protein